MKKKMLIMILSVLLLTGCTVNYNLEVENNSLKEVIYGTVTKEETTNDANSTAPNIVNELIYSEKVPLAEGTSAYNREIYENGSDINYKFSYNYDMSDFESSSLINTCFENHEIVDLGDYYSIKLSGNFYCLYSKKINIAVTSNLKVASNNADKIKDNTYIWTIDKNTTDIELAVDKDTPYTKPIKRGISSTFRIVCFIILIILSLITYLLYKKKSNNEI